MPKALYIKFLCVVFLKITPKIFAYLAKKSYLCTEFIDQPTTRQLFSQVIFYQCFDQNAVGAACFINALTKAP